MSVEPLRCKGKRCRHRGPLPHVVEEGETADVVWMTKRCEACGRFTRSLWPKNPDALKPEGLCPDCGNPWDDCTCEFDPDEVEVRDYEDGGWTPPGEPEPWENDEESSLLFVEDDLPF